MSKRTTRMDLVAAVLVAVGAIAAGATASASAMDDPPAGKVVGATVLQISDDGKVVECDVEGDGASAALPTGGLLGVEETGDGEVTGKAVTGDATLADPGDGGFEVVPSEDVVATGVAVAADETGTSFVIGTTGEGSKVIASGGPEDIRAGTADECARIVAAGSHG